MIEEEAAFQGASSALAYICVACAYPPQRVNACACTCFSTTLPVGHPLLRDASVLFQCENRADHGRLC